MTREEVNVVLGEMIGELNASHTYKSGGDEEQESEVDQLKRTIEALDDAEGAVMCNPVDGDQDECKHIGHEGIDVVWHVARLGRVVYSIGDFDLEHE